MARDAVPYRGSFSNKFRATVRLMMIYLNIHTFDHEIGIGMSSGRC